jgi:hypothetical protein
MSYPATPGPPLSDDGDQEREIDEAPVADAASPDGTVGGVESTLTVTVAMTDPPAFVAVSV